MIEEKQNYRTQVRMSDHQNIPFTEEEIHLMIEMINRLNISDLEMDKVRDKLLRGYENLWNRKEMKTRKHSSLLMSRYGI